MKKLILLITTIFVSEFIIAQDKGYVALSIGASVPMGDFGSNSSTNEDAGLAKTGLLIDLSSAYKLGKNFGLALAFRSQSNAIDDQLYLDVAYSANPDPYWSVVSEDWAIGGLLGGAYGSFPIGTGKSSFEVKGLIGFSLSSYPEIKITGVYNGATEYVLIGSDQASSFCYLIGGGFKFNVGKRTCLLLGVDYFKAKPEFSDINISTSNGLAVASEDYIQSIETINFSFGFGIRL